MIGKLIAKLRRALGPKAPRPPGPPPLAKPEYLAMHIAKATKRRRR